MPIIGLVLAACGEQANNNATGDDAFPSLIGADGFPHEVVTTQGSQAASLYPIIFGVAVVIFILVEGLLLLAILRGRNKGKPGELPAQTHGNNRLEIVWTAIPLLVVLVLFAASTMVLARVEEKSEEPAVVLDVLAFRFGWTFTYKEPGTFDEATGTYQDAGVTISSSPASPSSDQPRDPAQDVVLPVGEPVLFRLNAADVIHSFYVPAFFFKRDAIPGRTNEFEVTIDEAGPLRRPVRGVLRAQSRPDVLQHPRRRTGRVRGLAGRAGSRPGRGRLMATTTAPQTGAYVSRRSTLLEWITTTDHKKIGVMYIVTSFAFFMLGGLLALGIRSELAVPGPAVHRRGHLQPALRHACRDDDLPLRDAHDHGPGELHRAAPAGRRGHGLPAHQRPVLLDAGGRRRPRS